MTVRALLASLLFLVATASCQAQRRYVAALEGTWAGDGLTLKIDPLAFQANKQPAEQSFSWENLWVRDATGRTVVFAIGSTQFVGLIHDANTMTVTRSDRPGTWRLERSALYPPIAPLGRR